MILVDTNVLLDVLEDDPEWADWSQAKLDAAIAIDTLAINPIIYSELSIAFARIEELEAVIAEASLHVEPIPREALFLAGKVFLSYRRARRCRPLPDSHTRCRAISHLLPDRGSHRALIECILWPPRGFPTFAVALAVVCAAPIPRGSRRDMRRPIYSLSWTRRGAVFGSRRPR